MEQTNVDSIEGPRCASDLAPRAYNNFWMDRGTQVSRTMRTSLVIDPPDGRILPPEESRRTLATA